MGGNFHVFHGHAFSPCCDAPDLSNHLYLAIATMLIVALKVVHRTSGHDLKAVQVVANLQACVYYLTVYSVCVCTYVQYTMHIP